MPTETFHFTGRDGQDLVGYRWDPAGAPVAAVQVLHGMGEHVLRYAGLAEALTAAGVVVYGHDQRGHGASAPSPEQHGVLGPDGWSALVEEVGVLNARIHAEHPDPPVGLVAHSMGSFAAQQYLLTGSGSVDAVALTGTAAIDLLEPALDLDAPLDLAMFNGAFQPARTEYDWLSRDEAQVDAYVADPACGFGLDGESVRAMFVGLRSTADPARLADVRPDLPVYLAVGDQDPVNGDLALLHALADRLRQAGTKDLTTKVYAGARHEILNETNREEVTGDLVAWLGEKLRR
ncbi:alpha/beta fold hydrolase [Umezawaea tangerina]|uniref:Alpha-beta hydrolase superfamily lysophospholipase n=1 Tax=Umezawaea tangerina TaxID=84725 RepID=A0A2T0SYY6_9PSEU|nr:alpha/beta hydrolase [Umezawaea tangerina]PRY38609.1 alpha-beta hydrolase superfamily lysophospholipase [Umezawaea tangerina]